MAAQTEAPDDLIAELARLMADEARSDKPDSKVQTTPVRIPGDAEPNPAPRFDGAARSERPAEPAPVRIPGDAPASAPKEPEPFSFDFGLTGASEPSEAQPASAPAPMMDKAQDEPETQQSVSLDHDSLADLIAAELASDLPGPASVEQPETAEPAAVENPTDQDNFGTPPIFGLGGGAPAPVQSQSAAPRETPAPAPAASNAEPLDPLDEIERLVGPAVRANIADSAPASPALRSLATPTIATQTPARAPTDKPIQAEIPAPAPVSPAAKGEMNSVDEAILAAAAATGAHVEWVNGNGEAGADAIETDTEALARPPRAALRLNRAVVGPLVAVGLLAVAGAGLYWVLGQGGTTTGPAPLLVADTTPTKEVPEADNSAETAQSVVFNEISGAETGGEEQLVSRDQADTEAVVAANTAPTSSGVLATSGGDNVDPNQDGLVNRKVRTVTVLPDGTIVSGDDSLAGSAILPVDRPNVPDVPGADFSTPELVASARAETATPAAVPEPAATPTPAASIVEPGADVPVVDATGAALPGRTVRVPMDRPDNFAALASAAIAAANAVSTPATPATATAQPQAAAPQQAAATSSGGASSYVQLASQRSEEAARQSAQAIATRYGVLFGGANLEIQRVDLGERGIYYRVLVPAASRESAANICTNVKAAGGDCLLL
ncbi:SPOR domain-containing protein [Devosia sp. XK-2]|uniref:SPOR domain-containing protein n=1 Tax=Devosia sp. XK-2 TaxID=3126689 RepID=UPI0030CE5FCF